MVDERLKKRLERLSELNEKGWDGYEALPIPDLSIANTVTLLNNISFSDDVELYPTGEASIQLEYYPSKTCPSDVGAEFEIFENNVLYSSVRNGEWVIEDNPVTISDSIAILTNLHQENE